MSINRRHFLKAASLAGLTVVTPMPYGSRAAAEEENFEGFDGPFFVMINLIGGWDVTRFCDPKGLEATIDPAKGPINWGYSSSEIINVGTAQQPIPVMPADYYGTFFDQYRDRITIVNGVDNGTNGHTQGERVTWSGTLDRGFPSIAALIAAEKSQPLELPVPFLTFGGYDKTGDLIVPTRLQNMSAFTKIVAPGVARFDGAEATRFHDEFAENAIRTAAQARLEAARVNANLPRTAKGLDALYTARLTEPNIGRVMDYFDQPTFDALGTSRIGQLRKQAMLALSTFEAGVAVSANLAFTGWDTHNNNIDRTTDRYTELFLLLADLRTWAEDRGLGDKLHIFVGSDFGRTPYENATAGKDHWAIGSWMHISATPGAGKGTVGATDDKMRGMRLRDDLTTAEWNDDTATKITPAVLHNDVRRLAGVDGSDFAAAYPLDGELGTNIFA